MQPALECGWADPNGGVCSHLGSPRGLGQAGVSGLPLLGPRQSMISDGCSLHPHPTPIPTPIPCFPSGPWPQALTPGMAPPLHVGWG